MQLVIGWSPFLLPVPFYLFPNTVFSLIVSAGHSPAAANTVDILPPRLNHLGYKMPKWQRDQSAFAKLTMKSIIFTSWIQGFYYCM